MRAKEITSLQHPLVKHLCKLRQSRELRNSTKTFLITGKKVISELTKKFPALTLITTDPSTSFKADEVVLVNDPILKKITGLEQPDGFAAVFPFPKPQEKKGKKLLLLNGLKDPGNMGTLFRTALGLGWEGILITPQSVDPFNDKALRAAKGSTLMLPFWEVTEEEIAVWAKEEGYTFYTADMDGSSLEQVPFKEPLILVLGNESHGASSTFLKKATKVSIPMSSEIESYNVAIAGSILMYHISKHNL
jgi:RNA methyltransferase, TrmH family